MGRFRWIWSRRMDEILGRDAERRQRTNIALIFYSC